MLFNAILILTRIFFDVVNSRPALSQNQEIGKSCDGFCSFTVAKGSVGLGSASPLPFFSYRGNSVQLQRKTSLAVEDAAR